MIDNSVFEALEYATRKPVDCCIYSKEQQEKRELQELDEVLQGKQNICRS